MSRLLFLLDNRLKHMSVFQSYCLKIFSAFQTTIIPQNKARCLRHWALITETIAAWMTSKQNSPNYNSRGPWDKKLANDSPVFSLIWGFKSLCIYEWSAPLNTPTLPSPSDTVTSEWGAELLITSVSHALIWWCYGNEVIPHLSQ